MFAGRSAGVDTSLVFVNGVAIHRPPKTSAGVRPFTLPPVLTPAVEEHNDTNGPLEADDFLFVDRRTGATPNGTAALTDRVRAATKFFVSSA